jgi:hypothetical protein
MTGYKVKEILGSITSDIIVHMLFYSVISHEFGNFVINLIYWKGRHQITYMVCRRALFSDHVCFSFILMTFLTAWHQLSVYLQIIWWPTWQYNLTEIVPHFKMILLKSRYGNKNGKLSSTLTNVTCYPSHEIKHQ